MKVRNMFVFLIVLLVVLGGFWTYVRLAPSDLARWNVDPATAVTWPETTAGTVSALTGGAVLLIPAAQDALARLDAVAVATARTTRLAGSVEQGRITWVTRSGFWWFPDYTTAQIKEDGLYVYARLRFGKADFGVNAARLNDWLGKM
jgi:hypothetical protein